MSMYKVTAVISVSDDSVSTQELKEYLTRQLGMLPGSEPDDPVVSTAGVELVSMHAWVLVESSSISAVTYNPSSRILLAKFLSGGVYQYKDVPPTVYEELLAAQSKGKYFAANIRKSYEYARLES